jgi:sugar phosphate isomerase/epimerase
MSAEAASGPPLFLWCGCVSSYDLLSRAEALHAGGYVATSALCADFAALEEQGWSPSRIAAELRAREARVTVLDPFLAWYPGWTNDTGEHAAALNATEDDVFRWADAVEAESMSVLTPFSGTPAPMSEVVEALGSFGDRAAAHGLRLHLEVIPTSHAPDLETGWSLIREVDRANVGLVLDTLHLGRGGCDPRMLDEIPLEKVFHIQLCDAPRTPRVADYFEEVVTYRDFPGEGELGVGALVRHLIRDGTVPMCGPEVFSPELRTLPVAEAGRLCAEKTRSFLSGLGVGA